MMFNREEAVRVLSSLNDEQLAAIMTNFPKLADVTFIPAELLISINRALAYPISDSTTTLPPSPPPVDRVVISSICAQVSDEVWRASIRHKPLNSAHEAFAVILEELEEFKAEVWKKTEDRTAADMRKELIQTAAMCVRAINDLGL